MLAEEMIDQDREILETVAQGRNRDAQHIDAIEEVLAELAALDHGGEILVTGRDDANVDLDPAWSRLPG